MINFKWSLVIVYGININCIVHALDPTISTNNSSTPSVLKTQVIRANPHTTTSIFTSPPTYYDFVSQSQFFVDNSLLIEYVLQKPITVITLARRFGKSLNINMINTFLTIEVDPTTAEIIPKSENRTKAYQIFDSGILKLERKTIKLEPKLLIKQRQDVMAQMNSFPVIHLNLGSPSASYNSLEDVCSFIVGRSMQTFDDHQYFEKLNTPEAIDYKQALSDLNSIHCASQFNDLPRPFLKLCDVLFSHFGKKVIMLIDEYDAVLNRIFIESTENPTEEFRESVIGYFAHFFGTLLKDNAKLQTTVITGIIPWKNSGVFSHLGQIEVKTMADDGPLEYYGMSPENVKDMLRILNNGVLNDTAFSLVENLYDGYLFGEQRLIKKYNPVAIAMFFNNEQVLRGYWTQTGSINFLLKKFIKFQSFNRIFSRLLLGADVLISNSSENLMEIAATNFRNLPRLFAKVANLEENEWDTSDDIDISTVFYMMYFSGYLTLTNYKSGMEVWMRFPNKEIANYLWNAYYQCLDNERSQLGKGKNFKMKIDAFAEEYGKITLTDQNDVATFTKTFYEYIQAFPTLTKKGTRNEVYLNEKPIEIFVESIHFMRYHQTYLVGQRNTKDLMEEYSGGIPDLTSIYNETLVVIEFKCCAQSAEANLNQTEKYEKIFSKRHDYMGIKKIKKIEMTVHSNVSVEVIVQLGRLDEDRTIDWDNPICDKLP